MSPQNVLGQRGQEAKIGMVVFPGKLTDKL